MKALLALMAGYVVGAKTGGEDLDRLGRSLKALCDTDEFADVVSAARAHLGGALRQAAAVVDGEREPPAGSDIVARVRHLVSQD
jgi:hypothetical protein